MKLLALVAVAALGFFAISAVFNRDECRAITFATPKSADSQSPVQSSSTPVIVELFTSEGCSSCPPADALLIQLERTQPVSGTEVIALGEHVDYWNHLGWADPYSSAALSARQGEYAQAFGKDGVYTPQMIVDGQTEFVGSNMDRAREAISNAARAPKASVQVSLAANATERKTNGIGFSVRVENMPAVSSGDTAEVMLAITESDLRSQVARGENAGRSLRHIAVVRQFKVIGSVNTAEGAFTAEPIVTIANGWKRANLRAVVFVQERASRRVLGAKAIELAAR